MAVTQSGVAEAVDVERALDECATSAIEGAMPTPFQREALKAIVDAVRPSFVDQVKHWEHDRLEVRRIAWHLGAIARLIASMKNEAPIGKDSAIEAAEVVQRNCTLGTKGDMHPLGKYCTGAMFKV